MEIKKCLDLRKARDAKKGKENSALVKNIGKKFFPNSSEKTALESLSRMQKVKREKFSIQWVEILCSECGVDPNFVFGHLSRHDMEYQELVRGAKIGKK